MAEAADAAHPAGTPPCGCRPSAHQRHGGERRLVAAATAAILLGGTAGMAAAAQHALPGEALYPVKRGIERVETRLSGSDAGRGRDLLAPGLRPPRRGARACWHENAADADLRIPSTLGGVHQPGPRGRRPAAGLLRRRPATPPTIARGAVVRGHAAAHPGRARRGRPRPARRRALRDAVLALGSIDSRAEGLCGTCSDLAPLDVPATFLVASEAQRALRRGRRHAAGQQPPGAGAPRPAAREPAAVRAHLREAPDDDGRRPARSRPAGRSAACRCRADTALRGPPAREPAHQGPAAAAVSDLPSLPARRRRHRHAGPVTVRAVAAGPLLSAPSLPVTATGPRHRARGHGRHPAARRREPAALTVLTCERAVGQ